VGIDAPRRPDTPQPPQPKPPQPDAAKHADWHARNDTTMTRRPERSPDTRQRGPDQQLTPRQPGPIDGRQQPGVRADVGARPDVKGRLSIDHREWKAELRTVRETRDVNQWRTKPDGPVNMDRVRADFTKDVKHQAELHKASGSPGGVLIDVRLTNVGVGKASEAVAIQRNLTEIGRKDGVLVRVAVDRNGVLYSPGGQRLTPPAPRQPTPPVPHPPTLPVPHPPRPHPPDIHHR
jgi:hypothetical protein